MLPPFSLEDYGISPEFGFLPPEPPLTHLPNEYYAKWESIVGNLQPLLLSKRIRAMIDGMPVLSTEYLHDEPEWRRAYVVLVFMLHGYVWGGDRPVSKVPPQLTIPLFQVCDHLDLPPVATYAGVCLWNYKPIFGNEPSADLQDLACLQTFTGSLDEQWFYLVSVAIEARGAPSIPLMLDAIVAASAGQTDVVADCLQEFAGIIDQVTELLQQMYDNCDPYVFYNRIRPYLAGSKNMTDAGLPKEGLNYDDGSGVPIYRQYGGGSNAQSSLIQFFDIILGVEHRPTGTSREDPAEKSPKAGHGFIHEMRSYMPGPHRRFLNDVEAIANIKEYVDANRDQPALVLAFDACLATLRNLRDKHIQLVSRYIIIQSRGASRRQVPQSSAKPEAPVRVNLASAARDETGEAAVGAWAQRLLSNGPPLTSSAPLSKVGEHADGHLEVVGLCGTWTAADSEGGICHW
ncbi:hypothetical protein N7470_005281 [Penicillium chermesinum]|nr:hypothetical protein N7470_005281 [Penicillium chermesinum]